MRSLRGPTGRRAVPRRCSHVKGTLDRSAPLDLHQQVAAELRRAIADGEAKPGERLPPTKDFAAILDVNTNTVLRALRTLRDEGLLEFRRGRGITVAGTPERSAVIERAEELLHFARTQGYQPDEVIRSSNDSGDSVGRTTAARALSFAEHPRRLAAGESGRLRRVTARAARACPSSRDGEVPDVPQSGTGLGRGSRGCHVLPSRTST